MYGNTPDRWDETLSGDDRLRAIVNAFTRMRYLDSKGRMNFTEKESADRPPAGLIPWFDAPGRRTADVTVIFGHWSTLGLLMRPNLIGLDTGCVWGGALTAVRLQDREVFQVRCPRSRDPAAH
jgi:bis(5'-nucleosyl)-tetraphosphatase (symmetrical)